MAAKKKVVSIQAQRNRRGHKSRQAQLNDKTLARANRAGLAWTDDDVDLLMQMIERDEHTVDMALSLERTFYGTNAARAHVAWAMRHQAVLWRNR